MVWSPSNGPPSARPSDLYSHPDSFTTVIGTHRIVVERLASEHSDRLTREAFFAGYDPEVAQ